MAAAAAAVIIAALVVIPNLGGGRLNPAQATAAVPLHATTAAKLMGDGAATGRATAHQAGPSWTFQMTVHGLKVLPGNDVYECWWVGPGSTKAHPQFVSGGTFVVDNSGSATVTMTTGIDPRQFRTMEVTAESPGTGALHGVVASHRPDALAPTLSGRPSHAGYLAGCRLSGGSNGVRSLTLDSRYRRLSTKAEFRSPLRYQRSPNMPWGWKTWTNGLPSAEEQQTSAAPTRVSVRGSPAGYPRIAALRPARPAQNAVSRDQSAQ